MTCRLLRRHTVTEFIEPLEVFRNTVKRWGAERAATAPGPDVPDNVILLLDPQLVCDSFRAPKAASTEDPADGAPAWSRIGPLPLSPAGLCQCSVSQSRQAKISDTLSVTALRLEIVKIVRPGSNLLARSLAKLLWSLRRVQFRWISRLLPVLFSARLKLGSYREAGTWREEGSDPLPRNRGRCFTWICMLEARRLTTRSLTKRKRSGP